MITDVLIAGISPDTLQEETESLFFSVPNAIKSLQSKMRVMAICRDERWFVMKNIPKKFSKTKEPSRLLPLGSFLGINK
jgi:hypothetical protein